MLSNVNKLSIMETDVQQAIEAEKTFNNRNLLLVTFLEEEVNTNTFKQLHKSVREVQLLRPEFSPKCRYIIEVEDLFDIHAVKDVIMRHNFENRPVHVNFLDKFNDSYLNLDPYKLHVNNLPITISPRELKQLYPLCTSYTFLLFESVSRSVLVHFSKIEDSITAYKTTNFMQYQSNILRVKFYRKDIHEATQKKEVTFAEDYDNSESPDNDPLKWKDIKKKALKDKKMSNALLVNNLPMNTTGNEIQELFPTLDRYKFIPEYRTKSCIVQFEDVKDAIYMYQKSVNIFKSNELHIDFYDTKNDSKFYEKNTIIHKNQFCSIKEVKVKNNDEDQYNSRNEQNKEERIDRFVLHVENLPLSTNNEDIHYLFPGHFRHEIISIKDLNSVSAHVYFKTAEDTLKAYNANKNIFYKRNILSVKFKTKKFKKPNPFALMKRSTAYSTEGNYFKKQRKLDVPKTNNDEIIIIDDGPSVETSIEDNVSVEDNCSENNYFDDDNLNNDLSSKDVEFGESSLLLDDDDL